MKISVNWVKQYTDVKLPADELAKKIGAQLGEVEEVIDLGAKYKGAVIAKVVSCVKHPNADKLHVCKIDDKKATKNVDRDKDGYVQVVCGAPNVREGLLVTWLPPGAVVPSTYDSDKFTLEARALRGEVSNGMLASAAELGISDDHSGILEVDPKQAKPGDSFAKAFELDDYIIDVENKMFTHRPDCFGILGVAREIAGIQNLPFTSPKWYLGTKTTGEHASDKKLLTIKNDIPKLVPRFMAQVVQDVTVKPSDGWMQSLLTRVGIKPINNIVDITNYMMYLTGQPMHAYDYDKVAALDGTKTATITVRYPKKGEKIKLLNGKEIEPRNEAIMIASGSKLIGVGGIMGGSDTEVDQNTKNIILECASFDMYSIRRTSMAHGLFTDAVTRFNKGQSPLQNDRVMAYAVGEIVHQSGGMPARSIYDLQHNLPKPNTVGVTSEFINERLGTKLTSAQITKLLTNVEFKVTGNLKVTAPFWRTDIAIPEDIVEEVGRLYGYDHLPLVLPNRDLTPATKNDDYELKARLRNILSKAGANEVLTYSFVHSNLLQKAGQDPAKAFQLSNAISPDLQYYRLSLAPSLLDKVHPNIKAGYDEFALFEMNKVHNKLHAKDDDGGLPKEFPMISLVYAANSKATGKQTGAPYFQVRRYLDYIAEQLGISLTYVPMPKELDYPVMKPYNHKRSAVAMVTGTKLMLGIVGEFKASVLKNFKLPAHTAAFELGLPELAQALQAVQAYQPLSKYPKTQQDISFKVRDTISYYRLYEAVERVLDQAQSHSGYDFIIEPLDIYQSADSASFKHISFRIILNHFEKTLTTEEVNKLLDDVAAHAKQAVKAKRI